MSFIYSQALVAASSPGSCLGTEQSALLSGSPTPKPCLWHDKTMEPSRLSRFGMTCKPLTAIHGAELLTSWLAAFRVKTSALPETAQDLTESVVECGTTWPASLAKYDPASHTLKTAQLSLLEDLTGCSVTLPRSGLMLDGQCWELPMLGRITRETESGFLPTPVATDAGSGRFNTTPGSINKRPTLALMARKNLWPTPQASDNRDMGNLSTPAIARRVEIGKQVSLSMCVSPLNGRLNPEWVEVLMGWPNEMTSLNPISSVKMCFWLMGFCDDEKTGRTQVLRVLREGNAAKEIRAAIGRPVCISEAAFLLHELCEYANRPYEARIFMACAETLEGEMRSVRIHEGITGAPHRPGQGAQRPEKHTDSMQALSRLLAHHGQEAWENGSWEDGIPRVADGMANRSDRIIALGNGQIPRVVATAWRLLSQRFND